MRSVRVSRSQRRPIWTTSVGGNADTPGPNELNGRPLPTVTSSARSTRRRLVGSIRVGGERVERGEAGVERGRRLRLQAGANLGVLTGHVEVVDRPP